VGRSVLSAEADNPLGYTPQTWEARHAVATDVLVPWIESKAPLAGKTVLEYGCGGGAVSCALAARSARHIGVDIDADAVEHARARARELGIDNSELEAVAPEEIFERVRSHAGEVDVFCFYAVLEHMTIEERLEALRTALEVVKPDGLIAVVELPNRLIDMDYHTSLLPFFDQLPPELALRYVERSPRSDFRQQMLDGLESDPDAAPLALTRWGRGASYHEFELVFGDLRRHVVGGGYDPKLLGERAIHREELALARYVQEVRPDLPPAFSRYWLDLLISPLAVEPAAARLVWPWAVETESSRDAGWTPRDTIALAPRKRLAVRAPVPTSRVVCVVAMGARDAVLTLRARGRRARRQLLAPPGHPIVVELDLDRPVRSFTLEVNRRAELVFVGFELPADYANPVTSERAA
jgi:SAM-dependent methyltransferase